MSALISEFVTYVFKYIILLIVAVVGFLAGKAYRKSKDNKGKEA